MTEFEFERLLPINLYVKNLEPNQKNSFDFP